MATSEKPVFIPPKKRSTKKPNETSTPARIHSYDIITNVQGEDFKSKLSPESKNASIFSQNKNLPLTKSKTSPKLDTDKDNFRSKINKEIEFIKEEPYENRKSEIQLNLKDDFAASEFENANELSALHQGGRVHEMKTNVTYEVDIESATEKSALNDSSKTQDNYVTMTGTIKRGKKAGQSLDVVLNMSREELEELEASIISQKPDSKQKVWSIRSGIHVLVWTLLCIPFIFIISGAYSFYIGTLTWYNIYLYFSEEQTIWHKICICPFLIMFYPFFIVIAMIGLGSYAAGIQVSWNYDQWMTEVQDLEKGFYGWLCSALKLEDCSPYEVVILNDAPSEPDKMKIPVADTAL